MTGAYYYYHTEPGKNYQETMLDLKAYADKEKIPISWILYDSWWYLKESETNTPAQTAAVVDWRDAMPSIFPDGLRHMWNATGWPVVAHNREWSPKATMAARNGGKYPFAVGVSEQKGAPFAGKENFSLPLTRAFWDDLLSTVKEWRMQNYQQDWPVVMILRRTLSA